MIGYFLSKKIIIVGMSKNLFFLILFISPIMLKAQEKKRVRDYGVKIGVMRTGKLNSITDVAGVKVGQTTLIKADSIRTRRNGDSALRWKHFSAKSSCCSVCWKWFW